MIAARLFSVLALSSVPGLVGLERFAADTRVTYDLTGLAPRCEPEWIGAGAGDPGVVISAGEDCAGEQNGRNLDESIAAIAPDLAVASEVAVLIEIEREN